MKHRTRLLRAAVLAAGCIAVLATWSVTPDAPTRILLTANIVLAGIAILALTHSLNLQRNLQRNLQTPIPQFMERPATHDHSAATVPRFPAEEVLPDDSTSSSRAHACFLWHAGHFDSTSMVRGFTNIGGPATHLEVKGPPGVEMSITPSTLPTESGGTVRATHPKELPVPFSFTVIYSDRLGAEVRKAFTFTRMSMHLSATQ